MLLGWRASLEGRRAAIKQHTYLRHRFLFLAEWVRVDLFSPRKLPKKEEFNRICFTFKHLLLGLSNDDDVTSLLFIGHFYVCCVNFLSFKKHSWFIFKSHFEYGKCLYAIIRPWHFLTQRPFTNFSINTKMEISSLKWYCKFLSYIFKENFCYRLWLVHISDITNT